MSSGASKTTLISVLTVVFLQCCGQDATKTSGECKTVDKQPNVAGQFYPADPQQLSTYLDGLFATGEKPVVRNTIAIISPHAGMVYSGEVAASAFNQIDGNKTYKAVFIIASSHTSYFDGASVYTAGDMITPLGKVKVNRELSEELCKKNKLFSFISRAYEKEHSLEIQLPFLQKVMKKDFTIVPIIIGTQSPKDCKSLAATLRPYFNEDHLFIISSDFSHYPEYNTALKVDRETADAIIANDPEKFLRTVNDPENAAIPELVTRICGWTSVLTLLYITEGMPESGFQLIRYRNSGDVTIGDKSRVVGYNAIAVFLKEGAQKDEPEEFSLTEKDKKDLLHVARKTIETYIGKGKIPEIGTTGFSMTLMKPCGAFVTLHKKKELRGCIGRFNANEPLYTVVQQMAIAASTQDTRFPPVNAKELPEISLEISVLSPMKKISDVKKIVLGKHGIYIVKGNASGTFLPQVATETGWNLEEFLGHCSRDKAGLGWDGWKEAEIYTYEAVVFGEE